MASSEKDSLSSFLAQAAAAPGGPLHYAALQGNLPAARHLLEASVPLNRRDGQGRTALHIAAALGNVPLVALLLGAADGLQAATAGDADGATAVHYALAPQLLEAQHPLGAAAHPGSDRPGVLHLLLEHLQGLGRAGVGAADRPTAECRTTPLMLAAAEGNEEAVNLLLGGGQARIEMQDAAGLTSLAQATLGGHLGVMRLLLDSKATVDRSDHRGSTPLMLAVEARQLAAAELLLARGAHLESLPPALLQQLTMALWQAKQECEAEAAAKESKLSQQQGEHREAVFLLKKGQLSAQRQAEEAQQECSTLRQRLEDEEARHAGLLHRLQQEAEVLQRQVAVLEGRCQQQEQWAAEAQEQAKGELASLMQAHQDESEAAAARLANAEQRAKLAALHAAGLQDYQDYLWGQLTLALKSKGMWHKLRERLPRLCCLSDIQRVRCEGPAKPAAGRPPLEPAPRSAMAQHSGRQSATAGTASVPGAGRPANVWAQQQQQPSQQPQQPTANGSPLGAATQREGTQASPGSTAGMAAAQPATVGTSHPVKQQPATVPPLPAKVPRISERGSAAGFTVTARSSMQSGDEEEPSSSTGVSAQPRAATPWKLAAHLPAVVGWAGLDAGSSAEDTIDEITPASDPVSPY